MAKTKGIKMNNDKMIKKIKYAIEVLNILWVSHHANRGDAAIEGLEEVKAALAQRSNTASKNLGERIENFESDGQSEPAFEHEPEVSQPIKELFLSWWLTDMEDSEYFNRMSKLLNLTNDEFKSEPEVVIPPVSQPVATYRDNINGNFVTLISGDHLRKMKNGDLLYTSPPDYEALKAELTESRRITASTIAACEELKAENEVIKLRVAELEKENNGSND